VDNYYIAHWSLALDLKILALTSLRCSTTRSEPAATAGSCAMSGEQERRRASPPCRVDHRDQPQRRLAGRQFLQGVRASDYSPLS